MAFCNLNINRTCTFDSRVVFGGPDDHDGGSQERNAQPASNPVQSHGIRDISKELGVVAIGVYEDVRQGRTNCSAVK